MLSLYSSTHVQTLARVSLMLIACQALFCQEKWSQGFDHQEKAFRRAIAYVLPPSVRRKKCRGGTSLRKGKPFRNKYSWPKIKCLSLNINCNARSSLKRNLQRTLTRRGSSEKEMSRNRLEKVDMIKLKRNILFINLPSGSKLIFDHSQLCTRRAQGEWECILGLFEMLSHRMSKALQVFPRYIWREFHFFLGDHLLTDFLLIRSSPCCKTDHFQEFCQVCS